MESIETETQECESAVNIEKEAEDSKTIETDKIKQDDNKMDILEAKPPLAEIEDKSTIEPVLTELEAKIESKESTSGLVEAPSEVIKLENPKIEPKEAVIELEKTPIKTDEPTSATEETPIEVNESQITLLNEAQIESDDSKIESKNSKKNTLDEQIESNELETNATSTTTSSLNTVLEDTTILEGDSSVSSPKQISTSSRNVDSEEKMDVDEPTTNENTMEIDETNTVDSPTEKSDDSSQLPAESSPASNETQTLGDISENNSDNSKDVTDSFLNSADARENGENENTEFVHVTENAKEIGDKPQNKDDMLEIQDEEDFQSNQPQEDPIASDTFENNSEEQNDLEEQIDEAEQTNDEVEQTNDEAEQTVEEEQGGCEELCIIPDTERVISQAEKDAATSLLPLRDGAADASVESPNKSTDKPTEESSKVEEPAPPKEEKFTVTLCADTSIYACMQCLLLRKPKYSVQVDNTEKSQYVCDDNCLQELKKQHGDNVTHVVEGDLRVKNLTSGVNSDNMVSTVNYVRKCEECLKSFIGNSINLSWETMEFCNEVCLLKYQKRTGSSCTNCQDEVKNNCLGKYCVRFGHDIRQFCGSSCLEEYKKGLKVCSYCQKDISGGADGFLAPVKGQFKDFCSKECMEKYDLSIYNYNRLRNTSGKCSVCSNEKPITIEFEHTDKLNYFCSDPCFVAFKFVNNITPGKCEQCQKYIDNKILEQNSIYFDNMQHSFCSKTCQNIYVIGNRKIVTCNWCKVKKYNFDMIKKGRDDDASLCSLNCLNFYKVSLNAAKNKKVNCDQCSKNVLPIYHLTMSDATIRNFCSHTCVMQFQGQFSKSPITLNESEDVQIPIPTGGPRKNKTAVANTQNALQAEIPTIPVISSVQSLAVTNGPTSRNTRAKNNMKTQIKQHVIIKSAPIPPQRNMATMCKVVTSNKCISCKPVMVNKEIQTDEVPKKNVIIPIPIPFYIPAPVCMYSLPFPVPFPFPLPIPVPIFIPTTRNSASGIMKEIKKIQVKIPTDPFEAELLMMAEMVAGDKKEENTDSESEEEESAPAPDETSYTEPVDTNNTFGDDMLQMALKMATELEEPAVDLEGALTANTITASQTGETTGSEESVDDPQPIHHLIDRQPVVRGRKRPGRPPRSGTVSKRGRRSSNQMEIPLMAPPQPPPPSEPVEKPDANMCLKFTFGVNAWKQWVTTKNTELEKTSRRVKLFKPEILQLTADELNYSLCLFVKEVRKPNGQEYAPDTIYYLCLGIQQYLFENGRIDNIFCDAYYEKFTDCLDEVARKFSVLYNDSHYIVTRVEEEHLWESKQLGAHSPHVLLSTLMFFNTKHFNLTTVDEHMQLSFSHIMKHWKRNPNQPGTNKVAGSRNVLLRFYPPQISNDAGPRKKKVYEQQENEENPLRCPVKLYEFYLSKCPESVKTRNDVFYLLPERSCVPDSPVWYSTMPLPRNALEKMLHRVKMVKEINVALLTS